MSGERWRTSIRWVVAHPTEAKVLLARRDGALGLPWTERPGQVWDGRARRGRARPARPARRRPSAWTAPSGWPTRWRPSSTRSATGRSWPG
ncbi:MAG TPA: hypothetical protein VG411_17120 [Actinomycetota bacterium]|nr:hypothetical protein [Actinomycetota bacterium]